uniref:UBR-type domain-containing protein n=1 Tax=Caenorhabditis brenneri TaxID=135651 RepID=B6VBA4_CAEBE|nr:hypothetical protein Cbre_JD01.004 [Caenorhabditis brenneri]
MSVDPRRLAIGIARYVKENASTDIPGDSIGPFIYRLRVVDTYTSKDVDEIGEAMRIIIKQLINIPPVIFAPEVWIPTFAAVVEGGIDPSWKFMMESYNIPNSMNRIMVNPENPEENESDDDHIESTPTSPRACEQITSVCKENALKYGLPRRVFEAIWATDLEETMKSMMSQKWEEIKINNSKDAANQASYLLDRNIFDSFSEMKDYETFAKELYYASLARILKRLQEKEKTPPSSYSGDISFYESTFQIYDEVIRKVWPYLLKKDASNIKICTLKIFEKLLSLAPNEVLIQKLTEKFTDTCGWLKINSEEICDEMEPRLWTVAESLVKRLLELKNIIPCEIVSYAIAVKVTQEVTLASPEDMAPDDFEAMCEQTPSGSKKEMFFRSMLDATRASLIAILQFLQKAKSGSHVVNFLKEPYPKVVDNNETVLLHAIMDVYRECISRECISSEELLSIIDAVKDTPAIEQAPSLLYPIKDVKTSKIALERVFNQMADDLENEEDSREKYVKILHDSTAFWKTVSKNADRKLLNRVAKRFATVAVSSPVIRIATLATGILLTLFNVELAGQPESPDSICNVNFMEWEMDDEEWNSIGNKLIECNIKYRSKENYFPIFTLQQLQSVDDLSMRELTYVVSQMKFLKTKEGIETHKVFYAGYPKISEILKNFQSKSHKTALCKRLLEEFARIVATNEKNSFILDLDHEHIVDWLKDADVLESLTEQLVDLSYAVEVWSMLLLLQLDSTECVYEALLTLGRFWRTPILDTLGAQKMKELDNQFSAILGRHYEKQDKEYKTIREKRFAPQFNQDLRNSRLIEMQNRITSYLLKRKVEEFSEKSNKTYTWLLGVCAGQTTYTNEMINEAKRILARLYPNEEERQETLYSFIVSSLLNGISNSVEGKPRISLRDFFARVYTEITSSDMRSWKEEDSLETINRRMGGIIEWIKDVDEEKLKADEGVRINLILQLSHHCWFEMKTLPITELMSNKPEQLILTHKKFAEVISSHLDCLTNWMLPTQKPFPSASKLSHLFDIIFNFPEIAERHRKPIELCLYKTFDLFLRQEYRDGLTNQTDFMIQYTEKYQSSSLNYKREYYHIEPLQNKILKIDDVLKVFCKYGSENVQLHCLKKIGEALKTVPKMILENRDILEGQRKIETNEQKRIAYDVALLAELIGYFNCLYKQLETETEKSDETVLNAFMLLDSNHQSKGETNKRSCHSGSTRHHSDSIDMNFCTFKSTGDKFTNQHWYNCYTCNMMEQTGVCSTCAVNCHRGHDVAYSKKGQFFCDCGSQYCDAMRGINHYPNPTNSLRGHLPGETVQKTSPKFKEVFEYSFDFLQDKDVKSSFTELKSALKSVQEEFKRVHKELETILESVSKANRKALDVTKKQNEVVESFKNMDAVLLDENAEFMEPMNSGHFLPIRRMDVLVQERLPHSAQRKRDLTDIIKLDNGTELIIMIPDTVQTCLQLHYMDTRTHLIQGMQYLRTETEQIPFNAISLSVSGNRLVVCGVYEIYALRFSPQGTVIDRAHIKLLENGNVSSMQNNPVKKARFCRESEGDKKRRQLIAVATMQYIRVYDLTLHETNFVEEMVLTTGNVEDLLILTTETGAIRLLVLTSTGYLYEHIINDGSADNNSIFLTNVVNTPGMDMNGDGVSLHYSPTFNLLFVSLDSALYTARLPAPTSNQTAPIYDWKPLNIKYPVDIWREASGIISVLSKDNTDQVIYFHPSVDKISIQKTTVNRPIMTYFLMTSSKNQAIYSVLIYPDLPTCEIWETNWNCIPDLWIDDVPSERFAIEVFEQKTAPKPLEKEDLVLMAEQCELINSVDWNCRDIEMFYTHEDLNKRLLSNTEVMPITVVQQTHFTLDARITNSRQIVRMIRVEVAGADGPEFLKIGKTRYSVAARNRKTFDLKLSREESLSMDHKEINIEVIPRATQSLVRMKSLKLYGCDRSAMDEVQPIYERQPVLTSPNRLVYSILEFPVSNDKEWLKGVARKHLSRKLNHPAICKISTEAIVKCHPKLDEELFKIIDGAYLQEWKSLISWTESSGFTEMRMHHVEHLLERMETVRTRWPYFYRTLKEEFGSVIRLVQLMRDEMIKMPLHRCQLMAQAIVKVVFGLLSYGTDESEQLIDIFLNIFTDQNTYHLANDLRSAVQETISRYEHALKQERTLMASENKDLIRLQNSGFTPFYGASRILKKSPEAQLIAQVCGTIPLDSSEQPSWLEQLISKILEKLTHAKSTSTWQNISDSPSYNLSRVLASCVAICDPKIIGAHFSRLIRLIKYDADQIYPISEEAYSNYSLLRSVELLLFVCLEKRGEEKKENVEMLDSIVQELQTVGIRDLCFKVLEKVIPHWKERGPSTFTRSAAENRKVWLPYVPLVSSSANPPNVLNWPSNSDDAYIISCTDLVLLIPQHLQELDRRKSVPRDDRWIQKLCQLSSLSTGCSAYRQCKKLLLALCNGDETKYKIMKDKYKMQDLLQQLVQKYIEVSKQVGGHQQLTDIVDILGSITKLALTRPDMWRDVCSTYTTWLLRLACYTIDVVASQVVELLIVAVRDSSVGGQLSIQLADSIIEAQNGEFIEKIIKRFLIGKDEQLRWTLHGMLRSVIQLASRQNQCTIVKKLYNNVYPLVENLGIQGAQLVDLISTYAPRVFSSAELVAMTQSEISSIKKISEILYNDGYYGMYKQMNELNLGWKSIQFDRNPCLVCFTAKGNHDVVKMQSIRSDTRWSPNTIIYKLISNYEISKVTVKLTDVKKNKSIRKVSLYYSAKSLESVELKLHPELWRKCASVSVAENETSINLSLAVPVVTSCLIIDFEEVQDKRSGGQLHCPRCSGPVRTHSGVCDSCGENAFQCVKCRSINYVEKEPFLCSSCGYCKYARIEMFAVCRALPGAQHITCDAERGQCVQEISQLLTKMDTTKTKLTGYRAVCESLYLKNRPLALYKLHVENNHTSEFFEANGVMAVEQQAFQSITQPMNNLAISIRTLHAELCQQTQQLIYLHEELNRYDHASEVSVVFHKPQNASYYSTSETCFGCLCNQLLHSIALLHSSCDDENALSLILSSDRIIEKLGVLAQTYETLREEIEELLVRFMFGRTDITTKIEKLIDSGEVNLSVMVKSLMYAADPTWQQKLKLLVKFAIEKRDENSCLQALMVLNKYLEATKSVSLEERKKMKMTEMGSVVKWLSSEEEWKDCITLPSTSKTPAPPAPANTYQWISECLFSQWMSVRAAANQLLISLSRQQHHEPIALLILCENLSKLSNTPSSVCDQFMSSCHTIVDSSANTKTRLFVQQFHVYLIKRIHEECAELHSRSISLLSDNTFGERLRCFVELLSLLLSGSNVENVLLKAGADDLLIFLLHSTIFLKRMMTRRTRAIDSSRMALEKLLKRVSCRDGTKLMNVCVESLKLVKDTSTLGIIVGVMMEIMNPQQETEESFLIQIEKDVAQEDFLQGRMTHNPYNSNDAGMGPLMRDIKNKICRDTEMIALMEDDNGMELLVSGNIISLSLSVREVYDRLWKRTNNGAPMLIVYRMRGLMGDAVETFIENFGVAENSDDDEQEDEQLVRMINCLTQCGGIDKLMDLLETNVNSSSGRFLLGHLRKMFERIVKTPVGRRALIERRISERMMSVIRTCCADPTNESKVQIGMELYKVVEFVVTDKQVQDILCGIREEDANWWFDMFEKRGNDEGLLTELHRKTAQVIDQTTASIGNIVLGSDASENVLVGMYSRILKWDVVDAGVPPHDLQARHRISRRDQTIMMTEQLANITSNILASTFGMRLKQKILDSGVIATTCQYLMKDLPNLFQPTESPEWKVFLTRPSLKLILTLLAGLARGHKASQKEIAKTTLKLLHRLEQVASDNSIGTLAENVIEALNEDEEVRNQIKTVRDETDKKKKQLAMMNREKQLLKMRMKVGTGGQIKVSSRTLHNEPSIDDTDSHACCICRESVIRGIMASGVYAFAAVDQETGKTSTVSMMVMVHLHCHKNAIRGGGAGRAADEWTRSKLHNAGAKCNVITPIALGIVSNEAWTEISNRFETDIGRVSGLGQGNVNRNFVFIDICQLVDRFIYKRSFSNQSEGGGRDSNMQYLAVLHLFGVSLPADDVELEIAAPNHRLVAFLFTELTAESWNDQRNDVLRAGLNDAQTNGADATWQGFKPTLMTWAFIDSYFNKVIKITGDDRLEWLREHFVETINKTIQFVEDFDTNVLPCDDVSEFCDVTGASLEDVNMFINGAE